jgi:cobalt-zinc-cadmium efflux system membrane fusion protein
VRAGQPLAHIVSSDLAQASSDLAKADAAVTQTAATLARVEDLYNHHVVAQRELEQATSDAAQAQAEQRRARARVQQLGSSASDNVSSDFILRAPIGGEIVDRSVNPGAEVRNDNGVVLFTISSLDTLWLSASAYQTDLAHVRRGEHLVFTTEAAPDRHFLATVTYVSGALDSLTRTARVRATLPNPGHLLRPETFGQARLLGPDSSHVPVVPIDALVTRGSRTVVFVERGEGQFERRLVVVGDDDGVTASITDGLRPGELVVTRGSILLSGEGANPH